MRQFALHDMTVEQLVEAFTTMALEQDEAILEDENTKYNRLYDRMEALKQEMKGRAGDQRRALLPLLGHKNAQVRLKAAIATLAIDLDAARNALHEISNRNEYPQAADARRMMRSVDEGRYVPS